MNKREIGTSGIKVVPLSFGGNVFGWTINEQQSFTILDAFVDAGLDFIDTADVYSYWVPGNKGGESEIIIGDWLKKSGKRDNVIIATKVGKPMGEGKKGLSRKYITEAVEASLKRLQTDYIDLYQSHDDDKDTPFLETLETYTDLIKQGKVRAIGASNYDGIRLKEALQVSKDNNLAAYQCLQPEYNLYEREYYEKELEPVCRERNVGVITYFSLASGFLTGKYRSEDDLSKSNRGQGVKKYLNPRGYKILAALDKVSAEYNTTPATVAIAWVIARPGITAPIASATSIKQLDSLIKATELKLNSDAIDLLNSASSY
ncbi:aryl-alcohol dehydrogenase-like predicted oxidoreductase [Mucilaginibacter frigoritolerans]|uniref:Aryl-alcohol dehydrogenase-like predicted oxidoreductase n=1 Tax=Mucilaginibacter frigoritolerans TaxID=652788 RepID=A0A562TYH3_9SPHI|nr:aldo/keto reductase [Mucilaginibacter frigoritolerans]TWI98164.1 aryl-alcohol dehydrogenase-like predicted oxidoreductase [Mucilaginibacter frigoritolerans]